MSMARIKRFQIPVNDEENRLLQRAARAEGLPTAEWARRRLRLEAERTLSRGALLTAREAVMKLASLNAPVTDVETMVRESTEGRYGDDRLP